ncbi:MAG: Sua5/YciO/YrdC/YwlC family protein [Candidatus Nomurabacteria bacterium GW2011_GWE1_32_28]|uniref:Threonylcarbamoyl-AMP synthase n=1 Tax=Candidatus Nomurabacteria bacterium GW2011_GWF1_31_48 TaxID=1618767 RepID=A0A0F9YF69_9BACT|nr:MAG: Sua5/YciO/YrdC/YwlC family protein [Candidatus Nomurabacteria bacterium GW2011_GWF2_30_133]KKP28742.1 MAG: Sua5/YciO/YrdC/YwlC family protein [Candidatus Nomurabacteria bacterium GW2011_GWE2_31_40]KKP30319.1 MAG: Sua5/YciO/YrdC/YwlC family protein [Candidatus Nomurabacteria bacterium GW2011_GWF1_31_48]KKP34846.1 MAG: Sua5/YciO/YrdC/YwlC family protein [Candidatus Nomurabacteria bacterium GW2011_GWE1_32_28]HAS80696.1 threonylcarbamoyl-AMP synthase [Candidatus Nomurabacteria bacterium]
MQTEVLKITDKNSDEVLKKAALIIKNGGLVVFPTETVYGLGANIFNEEALKNIFLAKGRPSDNPLIVHISNKDELKELVDVVSEDQQKMIDAFWPGPLTIIFEKKDVISNVVSGGLSTIAVRMPSDVFANKLIGLAGVPIAAPSANTSGRPSGTMGIDILDDLLNKVDMIIDSGKSKIGVESTVVKINNNSLLILRPGAITKEMLEKVVSLPVTFAKKETDLESSPGTKYRHYAPNSNLEIIYGSSDDILGNMLEKASALQKRGLSIGIISTKQNESSFEKYKPNVFNIGDQNNLKEISKNLYSALRFFDLSNVDVILCQSFLEEGLGVAIMDRLRRASGKI